MNDFKSRITNIKTERPALMVVRSDHIINSNLWQFFPVINVDRVKDIPCDYPGAMGVPITFTDKLNREQFEILDCVHHVQLESGRHPYRRLVVRNLHPDLPEYIDLADWFRKMGVPLYVEFMDGVGSAPPNGRCGECAHWYKNHCAHGPCATEPTDADFFCGSFEPKGGEKNEAD